MTSSPQKHHPNGSRRKKHSLESRFSSFWWDTMMPPFRFKVALSSFSIGGVLEKDLLGQWLNFKLFGITYLVGKIKFNFFFSGSIGWVRGNWMKLEPIFFRDLRLKDQADSQVSKTSSANLFASIFSSILMHFGQKISSLICFGWFFLLCHGKSPFSGWWFQIVFMFTPIWGNDTVWLIFFRWVETTT